jgi:hypothetical protein
MIAENDTKNIRWILVWSDRLTWKGYFIRFNKGEKFGLDVKNCDKVRELQLENSEITRVRIYSDPNENKEPGVLLSDFGGTEFSFEDGGTYYIKLGPSDEYNQPKIEISMKCDDSLI